MVGHKDSRTRILCSRAAECLLAGAVLAGVIEKVQKKLASAA